MLLPLEEEPSWGTTLLSCGGKHAVLKWLLAAIALLLHLLFVWAWGEGSEVVWPTFHFCSALALLRRLFTTVASASGWMPASMRAIRICTVLLSSPVLSRVASSNTVSTVAAIAKPCAEDGVGAGAAAAEGTPDGLLLAMMRRG